MRKLILVIICVFLAACVPNKVDRAIDNGFDYLNEVRNDDYSYDDGYLLYVYGGEKLECPKNCNITYRILDAFFNLGFIKNEFEDYSIIQEQVDVADTIMKSLLPIWGQGRLYNIQNEEMREQGGFALDTYCILGYIYKDKKMAEVVKDSLLGLEWENEDFYSGYNEFRHVTDEAWCTRLMIATQTDMQTSKNLVEKSIKETDELLEEESKTLIVPKINAVYHVLFLIEDLADPEFEDARKRYYEFLVDSIDDPLIENDTLTYANILDILLYSNYENEQVLNSLADLLVKRQEAEGQWYMMYNQKEDVGQVFATFRVILALNKYRSR